MKKLMLNGGMISLFAIVMVLEMMILRGDFGEPMRDGARLFWGFDRHCR